MKSQSLACLLLVSALSSIVIGQDGSDRLSQLRDSWQRARERAVLPIDNKYQEELKKLQASYTKTGKLEKAMAVKQELDSLGDQTAHFEFVGKWYFTTNKGASGVIKVTKDHYIDPRGGLHEYKISGRTITVDWGKGYEKFSINPNNPQVLKGYNDVKTKFVLIKIPEVK